LLTSWSVAPVQPFQDQEEQVSFECRSCASHDLSVPRVSLWDLTLRALLFFLDRLPPFLAEPAARAKARAFFASALPYSGPLRHGSRPLQPFFATTTSLFSAVRCFPMRSFPFLSPPAQLLAAMSSYQTFWFFFDTSPGSFRGLFFPFREASRPELEALLVFSSFWLSSPSPFLPRRFAGNVFSFAGLRSFAGSSCPAPRFWLPSFEVSRGFPVLEEGRISPAQARVLLSTLRLEVPVSRVSSHATILEVLARF